MTQSLVKIPHLARQNRYVYMKVRRNLGIPSTSNRATDLGKHRSDRVGWLTVDNASHELKVRPCGSFRIVGFSGESNGDVEVAQC
jgi:hypothetical protein